jgi:replication factor C large subunit
MTAGVAAARGEEKGGWTRYGPPSYWSKLGRSRGRRDTRDYVARAIAEAEGVSMATARRRILPFLSTMTHHCTNRELTVAMAARYELDAEHVAFVTGSGEDTNKVASVVADAEAMREEAAVEHGGNAFADAEAGLTAVTDEGESAEADAGEDEPAETEEDDVIDLDDAEADDQQSGLSDFV